MPSEIEFSARTISIAGRRLTSTMPAKERFGHYPRESRPIMLTWSFGTRTGIHFAGKRSRSMRRLPADANYSAWS
jgi:hypothetical protein